MDRRPGSIDLALQRLEKKVIAQTHWPVLTIPFTTTLQRKKERDGFYEFGETLP